MNTSLDGWRAVGAADEALRLYERKGIVPSAARTRELIAKLRGPTQLLAPLVR